MILPRAVLTTTPILIILERCIVLNQLIVAPTTEMKCYNVRRNGARSTPTLQTATKPKKKSHATIPLALVSREVTWRGEPKDMNTDCSSDDNSFNIYHNSWDMFYTDKYEGRTDCSSSDTEDSALYQVPGG